MQLQYFLAAVIAGVAGLLLGFLFVLGYSTLFDPIYLNALTVGDAMIAISVIGAGAMITAAIINGPTEEEDR